MKVSANLGFLFPDLPLPERILLAKDLGFAAVELHWPYDTPAQEIRRALDRTGLQVLSLNTVRGDVQSGENGLAALAGRVAEARAAIVQAIDYGQHINARYLHVMAGRNCDGADWGVFERNLAYAAERAGQVGMTILIEPLNPFDAPDYLLASMEDAVEVIERVAQPNIRVMFDLYHLSRLNCAIEETFLTYKDYVGHVQFASVPDRAEPDQGTSDVLSQVAWLHRNGYDGYFGAEYKPRTGSFEWLSQLTRLD